VLEAAVIAVPHFTRVEHLLACVVPRPGTTLVVEEIIEFLRPRLARWAPAEGGGLTVAAGAALVAGALLLAQAGASNPASSAVERIIRESIRPLPQAPAPQVKEPESVWVPDRWVPTPGSARGVFVPGHWERRLPDGQHYVPPLPTTGPQGEPGLVPGGVRPAPDRREGP